VYMGGQTECGLVFFLNCSLESGCEGIRWPAGGGKVNCTNILYIFTSHLEAQTESVKYCEFAELILGE